MTSGLTRHQKTKSGRRAAEFVGPGALGMNNFGCIGWQGLIAFRVLFRYQLKYLGEFNERIFPSWH